MTGVVKLKSILIRNKFVCLSFFLPFILMIFGFIWADFYPFGPNQAAVIDLYHQYFPFLSELQNKLQTGGSLLYSWNGGLGTNFVSLMSYYTASPLYLLTALIPQAYLMEGMTVLIAVKVGAAGACMAIYLQGIYRHRGWSTAAFATLYALCAYVMGYYWCMMWLDVVAVLPLCILGLNRLIDRGEFKLYTISLAVMMLTNYYIGGMMCIFIFFYYPVLYFSQKKPLGTKGCLKVTGKAVFCSFLGIAISAVFLLPTFLNLQNTYYIDSTRPEESIMYKPLLDIFTNLLPGMEPTVREGLPNIYCGMVTVILLVFYVMCRTIPVRKRLLNCGMLAFLVLSLNWNQLDFLWHGAHFPNQLPFRYSFVFSFLMISLAYDAFLHLRHLTPKTIGVMTAALAGYIILAEKLYKDTIDSPFAYISLALLLAYCGIFALYKTKKIPSYLMGLLVLVMVTAEMMAGVVTGVTAVSHTDREQYMAHSTEVKTMVKEIQEKDTDFYRMGLLTRTTLNDPMLYHYPGLSQFSSTVNGSVSYLLDHMGLEGKDVKNRYNYVDSTPLINGVFNTKYLMGKGTAVEGEEDFFTLEGGEGTSTLYRNKYPLSVGFMMNKDILHWDYDNDSSFAVQNDLAVKASGAEGQLLTSVGAPHVSGVNVRTGAYENEQITCSPENSQMASDLILEFEAKETQNLYAKIETGGAEWITAQDSRGRVISLQKDCGAVVNVGKYNKGEKVKISIHYPAGQAQNVKAAVYGLDMQVWQQVYQGLADEQLQVTMHDDRNIEGKIAAGEDGYLFMSVPYEKGWDVEVDGEKVEVEPLADAFIMVPVAKGSHQVKIHYFPDGLLAGILVSIGAVIVLILLSLGRTRRKKILSFRKKTEI